MRSQENLLVVQTAFLGDVVLTTPLLRELRRLRPDARLTVLTNAVGADVLAGPGLADRIWTVDKRWSRGGVASTGRMMARLRREPFDVAIAAQRSFRTGLLLASSGAALRIGFARAPGAWAYHRRIARDRTRHAVRRYLELSRPLGGDPALADPRPELVVEPAARDRAEALLERMGIATDARLVALAPGSARPTKRWPAAGFARVAEALTERGLQPLLVGAPTETGLCAEVAREAAVDLPSAAGRTGVPELIALLARADLLVGNDSGPAHAAAALGTPVVSIFGPTTPDQGYTPFGAATRIVEHPGLACRPCDRRGAAACPLGHFRCMREVDAISVIRRVDEMLQMSPVPAQRLPG